MPRHISPYDESSAYGTVHSVPGTESFTQPGQQGTYSQSVLPEYGREAPTQSPEVTRYDKWLEYMNPPDTVSTEEYDYRTGLRREQAQEQLLMEKSRAETSKAAGAGEVDVAKAEALRKGDTTLEMINKMPKHMQELLRSSYILGKAGLRDQSLYDVLDRIKEASTKDDKERVTQEAAAAKANVEQEPAYPTRRGTTFIEDLLSPLQGGGQPAGELGVGEEQGFESRRAPVTREGQGPPVEQWQRNPKTGKLERVS